jgi:hypothetical protein
MFNSKTTEGIGSANFSINCIFCILSYNINWKNPKITIVYTNAIIYLSTKERIEKVQKTQWPREKLGFLLDIEYIEWMSILIIINYLLA